MKYLICSIIKNEHRYLAEWIEYHLSLGFDDIYLVEDYGSISHKEITDKYPNVHLTTCDNYFIVKRDYDIGIQRQIRVYHKFAYLHHNEGWCAFIDADEFIVLQDGYTLQDICTENEEYDGTALYWKVMSYTGHILSPNGALLDNYTDNSHYGIMRPECFKSIMNLHKYLDNITSVHKLGKIIDINGKETTFKTSRGSYTLNKAYIKHYYTKSLEDWMSRFISRGDLLPGNRKVWLFYTVNTNTFMNKNDIENLKCLIKKNPLYCSFPDITKEKIAVVGNKHNAKEFHLTDDYFVIRVNGCESRDKVTSTNTDLWFFRGDNNAFVKQTLKDNKLIEFINSTNTKIVDYPRNAGGLIKDTKTTFIDLWMPLVFDKVNFNWNYKCTYFTSSVIALCLAVYFNKGTHPVEVYALDYDRKVRNGYHRETEYEYSLIKHLINNGYVKFYES